MKSIFLMDVDTQRDFILPSGAWQLPGAERLIPKMRRLFDFARRNGVSIISTAETHPAGDHFGEFPEHCVLGTEGQRKIDDTLLARPMTLENRPIDKNLAELVRKYQQIVIHKAQFDPFTNPVTERLLRVLPPHAIVFGVPLEHSVRFACLGLRRMGIKTALVTDASGSLSRNSGETALAEMKRAGTEFITVEALLGALQSG